EPLSEDVYPLPFEKAEYAGEYTVTVSIRLKEGTIWAPAGHETAFGQYVYQVEGEKKCHCGELKVIRSKHNVGVRGDHFEVMFSALNGGLVSYRWGGREMIREIPKPNFWRAPVDNDYGSLMPQRYCQWKTAGMYADHHEYVEGGFPRLLEPA